MILDEVADRASSGGSSVTEIADAVGLSKSAAFAILQTLRGAGFVTDIGTGPTRRYLLGPALTRLGEKARAQMSVRDIVRPTMEGVAHRLGTSVRFGVLQGNRVSVIDRVDAANGMRIDLRMGDLELLHCTALGKAILASLDNAKVRTILADEPLARQTRHTITGIRQLLSHLDTVRDQGYAVDDEEDFEGITCIGAAVSDGASLHAGLSVTTIKARLTPERTAEIGRILAAAAAEISSALGGSPHGA
jgi:IclR family acetate operon transcriptional repressor